MIGNWLSSIQRIGKTTLNTRKSKLVEGVRRFIREPTRTRGNYCGNSGERDIHQREGFGDREGSRSGDEKRMVEYCFKRVCIIIKELLGGALQCR
mgnify:CR=1 FL=1